MRLNAYLRGMPPNRGPRIEFRLHELLAKQSPPMSQSELSRRSGVSLTTINAMMQNKTGQVSLETLDKLAGALGAAPGELIDRPLCAICRRVVINQAKVPDRSLYEIWCEWCGVYFIGGISKAQLSSLTPEPQRLPLADDIQAANARGLIGFVWGQPVADDEGALEAMNDEIVERFAIEHDGHLLDCSRHTDPQGTRKKQAAPSNVWFVRVDRAEEFATDIPAKGMKRGDAVRAAKAWYNREIKGARKPRRRS
jgi:DNA-binding Xre family transcriptional regulator